jgi:uncharacterized protein
MPYLTKLALKQFFLGFALIVGLSLMPGVAAAGALDDAKAAGLVGERPDGFVGVVPSTVPLEVAQLVEEINAQRRAAYADIAAKNGTSVDAVGVLTAEKLYQRAQPGEYLMSKSGQWTRK